MLFFKKRIDFGSFIRMIANEVIKVPQFTYEHYQTSDPDSVLSQSEFEEFVENLSTLRLLIFYGLLKDSHTKEQIKFAPESLSERFLQALQLSYQDNAVEKDEEQRRLEVFSQDLVHYLSYLDTIPKEDLRKEGYTAYACLYFTSKFSEPSGKSVKNRIYISLINTQRLLMKEYFIQALQKVKITK